MVNISETEIAEDNLSREDKSMQTAIEPAKQASTEISNVVGMTPMDILNRAVSQRTSIEVLEKLMGLQERWEANQARKAFDEAMSGAKAEIPTITKNRRVGFDSKKQGAARTDYRHEDLAEIARTVDPILSRYGLSYRFRTKNEPNMPITVTCIVSHRDGHCEENTLQAGKDESGNKNSIQAIGSTITYLQRYTLKAALGLAASNDDDGKQADDTTDESLTKEEVTAILKAIDDTESDAAKLCQYYKIEAIADLPKSRYNEALALINRGRKPA